MISVRKEVSKVLNLLAVPIRGKIQKKEFGMKNGLSFVLRFPTLRKLRTNRSKRNLKPYFKLKIKPKCFLLNRAPAIQTLLVFRKCCSYSRQTPRCRRAARAAGPDNRRLKREHRVIWDFLEEGRVFAHSPHMSATPSGGSTAPSPCT